MFKLVSRNPLAIRFRGVLLDEYRHRFWPQWIIQLGQQDSSIDVQVLNQRTDRIFLAGDVLGRHDDVGSRRAVDQYISVSIEYRPARRGYRNLAYAIVLCSNLVIIVAGHLKHVKANAERDEHSQHQVLDHVYAQLHIESVLSQVATHRTSS